MHETVNKVFLVGTLGLDPELRHTNNGKTVTTLRLATSHRGSDGMDRTEWHRVVLWGKHAEQAVESLKKGDRVAAEGRLKTSTWTDSKGEKRYRTEIDGRIVFPRGYRNGRSTAPNPNTVSGNNDTTSRPARARALSEAEAADQREFRAMASGAAGVSPPCSECGDITIRNGSCHVCLNCGATSGCS